MSSLLLSVIILGIVQGIAEFLPISSSAHLIIFRDLFGIGRGMDNEVAMAFDIALHLGTLIAILIFFYKDFYNMIVKGLTKGVKDKDGKILWYLVAATVPAAIAGVLFEDVIENALRSNFLLIALALAIMGVIIYLCDKNSAEKKEVSEITLKDSILIGCSQVFALVPGFSRSGTTIAAARLLKIKRTDAAKFSFFLSAPVVAGAVVLKLMHASTWTIIGSNLSAFIIGIAIACVTGLLCIKFLLKYLDTHNFEIFMLYRLFIAGVVILCLIIGV